MVWTFLLRSFVTGLEQIPVSEQSKKWHSNPIRRMFAFTHGISIVIISDHPVDLLRNS
jgi:hypothetical protein